MHGSLRRGSGRSFPFMLLLDLPISLLVLAVDPPPIAVTRYAEIYGPYAFGMVSLLIIWFAIVRPQLAINRDVTKELSTALLSLKSTALLIDNIVRRLERLEANSRAQGTIEDHGKPLD